MDPEILKSFMQLGGTGILGVIFYVIFKRADERLDTILEAMGKERELWRNTINILGHNMNDTANEISRLDCAAYKPRKKIKEV